MQNEAALCLDRSALKHGHTARVGWKLDAAYMHCTGRLNTVVDMWVLDDYNHYDRGMQALMGHPRFAAIREGLAATVRNETLVFLQKLSYSC